MNDRVAERRRRLTHRAIPLGALALVALVVGIAVGSAASSGADDTARRFASAWARGDYAAVHATLTPEARARYSRGALEAAYREADATATTWRRQAAAPAGSRDGRVVVPVSVRTRAFGVVRGDFEVPVSEEQVAWTPRLLFPGLREGDRLERRTRAPKRGRILTRDGKVLAAGPAEARSSPLGEAAAQVAGRVEPTDDPVARRRLYGRGFAEDAPAGQTGLERAFELEVAGKPGGELLAGSRTLASSEPRAARPVRSTIDSRLQASAVEALAGRFGGIAALDPQTAEIRAVAGIAFSAPQPPGSTFKIITTTAALEDRKVKPSTKFPVETAATIDGVELENANGESCGGSFQESFAHSCNSVFAPLGVKVGEKRLVEVAERYGFNEPPGVTGEAESTLPRDLGSPLDIGSTAIGQGRVLATPLTLASVAQTIAADGMRTEPTLHPESRGRRVRVTSPEVARTITSMMVDVVGYGTGTAAAIPDVKVAGKTGTAELEDTRGPDAEVAPEGDTGSNTDAWFTAFAPARRPKVAVGVLFVRAGAGGETAAPAARVVLGAALGK